MFFDISRMFLPSIKQKIPAGHFFDSQKDVDGEVWVYFKKV